MGARPHPCFTPQVTGKKPNSSPSTVTQHWISSRKNLKSRTNFSVHPTFPSNIHRASRVHCQTPSQDQRSRCTIFNSVLCFSPVVDAVKKLRHMYRLGRTPNCVSDRISFDSFMRLFKRIVAKIFPGTVSSEILW